MNIKKLSIISLLSASAIALSGCSKSSSDTSNPSSTTSTTSENASSDTSGSTNTGSGVDTSVFSGTETTDEFSITTTDGQTPTESSGVYTISKAGTYVLKGKLEGQIKVAAGDSDDVVLDLQGVSISYGTNSPIFIETGNNVDIKATADTYNVVKDTRANKVSDVDGQGEGAIYSKVDLKLKGQGILVVNGNYNNGVHTTKDMKVQKLKLKISSYADALRGNHKVNIVSGTLLLHSSSGDGIKTKDTDLSNSNTQRGSVNISGGEVEIYSFADGIDAAYDVNIYNGVDEDDNTTVTKPTVTIYTNTYMSYGKNYTTAKSKIRHTLLAGGRGGSGGGFPGEGQQGGPGTQSSSSVKATESAKAIKAENCIYVSGGSNYLFAYDDCLHANSGTAFSSGGTGKGDIHISGGNTTIFASDDGVHADNALYLEGGESTVGCAYEGYEALYITMTGGSHYAYATDDAINSSSTNYGIEIKGGTLFAAVGSGDTDTIDSNGYYKQSGGVVIAVGGSAQMASCFDVDGTKQVTGGSLICFGALEATPTSGSGVTKSSKSGSYSFTSSKTQKVTFSNNTSITGSYLTISSATTGSGISSPGTLSSSVVNAYSDNGSISSVSEA